MSSVTSTPSQAAPKSAPIAPRILREQRTVESMVRLYCRHYEGNATLCPACAELIVYAYRRLERCRFGPAKSTCRRCPVHCYAPRQREQMRRVMRYAGSRMLFYHPWMAMRHIMDGLPWF